MATIKIQGRDKFRPSSTGTPRAGQIGSVFTSEGQGLVNLTQAGLNITAEALQRRDRAIDVDYIANSNVKAQEEIQRINTRLTASREDPKGFANEFIGEADKVYQSFIDNAPSEAARQSLKTNFSNQRVSQFRSAFDTENKLIVDNVVSNASENVNIIANNLIDNPSTLEASLETLNPIAESIGGVLDKNNADNFIGQAEKDVTGSFIQGLIVNSRFDEAVKAIDSTEAKRIFSPDERGVMKNAVDAQATSNLKRLKDDRKAEVDKINSEFLKAERDNTLTVNNIMSSTLPAIGVNSKDYWIKRQELPSNNPGDPTLYSAAVVNVADMTVDEIYSLGDVDRNDLVGAKQPLTSPQIQNLLKVKETTTKQTISTYLKGVKSSITGTNELLNLFDTEGDIRYMNATFKINDLIASGRAKGLTVNEMFSPSGSQYKNYGQAILEEFHGNEERRLASRARTITAQTLAGREETEEEQTVNMLLKQGYTQAEIDLTIKEMRNE